MEGMLTEPTNDEQAIRELVDGWMTASMTGDTSAVLALMTDDVLFLTVGREPFGKDQFRAQSEALKDVTMDGRAEVREIEVHGDMAWIRNHIDLTITSGQGEPTRRSGDTLTILKRGGDGRWRLYRDANLVT
jgi:uncharacterized protein (TIGR02246 family)